MPSAATSQIMCSPGMMRCAPAAASGGGATSSGGSGLATTWDCEHAASDARIVRRCTRRDRCKIWATLLAMSEGPRTDRGPRDPASPVAGARIVVGVAGGIAAYKAAELVRLLDK